MKRLMAISLIILSGLSLKAQMAARIVNLGPAVVGKTTSTTPFQESLNKAHAALAGYFKQATIQDKENFDQYLKFFRAEGGYQAVTPAPARLRDSLSAQAKKLFQELKEYARPLTQPRAQMPGASLLSKEGEEYYQAIQKIVAEDLAASLKAIKK